MFQRASPSFKHTTERTQDEENITLSQLPEDIPYMTCCEEEVIKPQIMHISLPEFDEDTTVFEF
jgi:hypothetical protein